MATSFGVGILSRIDYGSDGFRQGLLEQAAGRFRKAKVVFVIIAGGLISGRDLKNRMPRKREEQDAFFDEVARELAKVLPKLGKGDDVKYYIMVSPAYDGPAGEPIAKRLAELRTDVRFYSKHSRRFGKGKRIAVLVPTKATWRAEYASVPIDRLVKDELKRSGQDMADAYVVGCHGVFVFRPKGGGSKCNYLGLPMASKPEEVNSVENQVGAVILEVNDKIRVTDLSFRDLVRDERKLVPVPDGLSDFDRQVFAQLQRSPATPGMIEEALHEESRDRVSRSLEKLVKIKRRNYPSIFKDESSGEYDFDKEWFKNEMRYSWPDDLVEDNFSAFGCMHAGCVHTDSNFVINKLAQILVDEGVKYLVGDGDFQEGLKHELLLRGEVIHGMNYTDQEEFAAEHLELALGKAFDILLDRELKKNKPSGVPEVAKLVSRLLITFLYKRGNHDDWGVPLGFRPLAIFRLTLLSRLYSHIKKSLIDRGLPVPNDLYGLVESKVIATDDLETDSTKNTYKMPSGLNVGFRHPWQGNAQTTTLRLQASLAAMLDCQIGFVANFHSAAAMTQYVPELGQRVGMQLGTLKHESDFEYNMNKLLDFGVGFLRVWSKNGRIWATQMMYVTDKSPKSKMWDGQSIKEWKKTLGIPKY